MSTKKQFLNLEIHNSVSLAGFFAIMCLVLIILSSHEAFALDYLTPEMFGAKGDGVVNDNIAFVKLTAAMEENMMPALLTKCYVVDSVVLPSGGILRAEGGVLKKNPKNEEMYSILSLKDNCTVDGLTLIGDRDENITVSEWGHCITIDGSNCIVSNCTVESPHGDGIYIHGNNVRISNCIIEKAYRNGISVTNGQNFLIENTIIKNVNGTAPQFGIDVEPNSAEDHISGIITNVRIEDCHGGILIYLNDRQINPAYIQCYDTIIERAIDRRSVAIYSANDNKDEFYFDSIQIIDPNPKAESFVKLEFEGQNNPKIFFKCLTVHGSNKNGMEIIAENPKCSMPIDIYLFSNGWSRETSEDGYDLIVSSFNSNINIHTNLEVHDINGTTAMHVTDKIINE